MITLENNAKTVSFSSTPSKVFSRGSLSKSLTRIMLYDDGQGVMIKEGDFRFTFTVDMLNPEFKTAHNLETDSDVFDLLLTWQNS